MTPHEQAEHYRKAAGALREWATPNRRRAYRSSCELAAKHCEKIADDLDAGLIRLATPEEIERMKESAQ